MPGTSLDCELSPFSPLQYPGIFIGTMMIVKIVFIRNYSDHVEGGIKMIILQCPFCGEQNDVEVAEIEHDKFIKYYIKCNSCESTGPIQSTKDKAFEDWNVRSLNVGDQIKPIVDNIRDKIEDVDTYLTQLEDIE